jgi:class 3 adenylate cyclase/tetratricopeptide (TPR) repeat protein
MLAEMTCPTCNAPVADGARFCSACGHPLDSRHDERRIATVLFADLVGFTSLSESSDPEQVKNLVDSCFERLVHDIDEFGGKVDKIIGDAILALFGAPVAHEDDAERAVRAALRMHETLSSYCGETGTSVRLRIGVNTGEVLVGSLRADTQYTAMGDVVNIAQRLQTAAAPGAVVVGPATYAATRDVIEYRALGAFSAKGREEPVEAYEAVTTLLPPGYRPRRLQTPFVGRESELGMLSHSVDAAFTRDRGHIVLLLGEAGVGKSRLAEEVAERARSSHRAQVFEGRCVPYGEANVWWPVAEALRQACGVAIDDPLRTATDLCLESVSNVLDEPTSSAEVVRVANGLLHLMGYEGPLDEIDAQRAREEATRSVLDFVAGSTQRRPVAVVLSDLHWADDVVLDMIDVLTDRLNRSRFVLVATARHGLLDRWSPPTGRHNNVLVNLDPLDRAATAELLTALAEAELDEGLRDTLLDRSGGNPFFLEELVALLAASEGAASLDDPHGSESLDLPDTLRGLVAARIDGMSIDERGTLDDAAVWGRSGPVEALERMAAQIRNLHDLGPVLRSLADKEILTVEGRRWAFHSDLVREVAYSTLTKADRAKRHCGIAVFLENSMPQRDDASLRAVDVIAHHYAATAELVREVGSVHDIPHDVAERAIEWLREAATRAELAQMPLVAERLYQQVNDLLDGEASERRVDVLVGRARAQAGHRHIESARCTLDEAVALAHRLGYELGAARCELALGDVQQKAGQLEESIDTLTAAAAAFERLGDVPGEAEALRLRGMAHIFRGTNVEAEKSISRALDAYRSLGDRRGQAWALQNLAWISYVCGRANEAEERLVESAETFTDIGDGGGLAWALGLMAFVRYHQGRFDEAEEMAAQVISDAHSRGDKWGEGMMHLLTAGVRLWSGRALSAVGSAEDALGTFASINDRFGQAQASGMLGRCLATAGEVTNGVQLLMRTLEAIPSDPDRAEHRGLLAATLASTAVQIGDVTLARRALDGVAAAENVGLGTTERAVVEGLLALQEGNPGDAIRRLEDAIDLVDGIPSLYGQSALALAYAAAGDREKVDEVAAEVHASTRATYLDKGMAGLAVELMKARTGDEGAGESFTDLIAAIDATDDAVAQAVFRLAEALALDRLRMPTSQFALYASDVRLADVGIEADGWRTVFTLALAIDRSPAGT